MLSISRHNYNKPIEKYSELDILYVKKLKIITRSTEYFIASRKIETIIQLFYFCTSILAHREYYIENEKCKG